MKIAFVSTMAGYPWGGSEELWFRVAESATSTGNEIVASVFDNRPVSNRLNTLKAAGVELHFREIYHQQAGSILMRGITSARKKIRSRLSRDFAQLVSFGPDSVCVNLAYTYHLLEMPDLRKFLLTLDTDFGLICQGHNDLPFSSNEYRSIVKECFDKARWIAFVSQANLDSTQRHLATDLPQAFVVNNPANLKEFSRLPFPSEISPIRFATVARFDIQQKGHDILFEALSRPEWQGREWRLSLVGSGPHQDYIEALIQHFKLQDRVDFLGQVEDLRDMWNDHHLLVLPSRFEGTPLSLIEAMLCGRSAVVTDVAGNCEWIDSHNGFIAAQPSANALLVALDRMWERRDELESLGIRCHNRAAQKFDPLVHERLLRVIQG